MNLKFWRPRNEEAYDDMVRVGKLECKVDSVVKDVKESQIKADQADERLRAQLALNSLGPLLRMSLEPR